MQENKAKISSKEQTLIKEAKNKSFQLYVIYLCLINL